MAKPNTSNTKPKADIDFENELWNAANELRGAVAENQYKNYVLSLLFLKHCLFILSKNHDGEHRERQQEVLFIDARKLGQMVTRRLRVFHDGDIAKIADTYHQWRNLNGSYTDIDGFCKAATLPEIEANNLVLTPGRYVGAEAEENDGVPFEEKMQKLMEELMQQFDESALLEELI